MNDLLVWIRLDFIFLELLLSPNFERGNCCCALILTFLTHCQRAKARTSIENYNYLWT